MANSGETPECKVVFTGHSGLAKERVLKKFRHHIFSNDLEWSGLKAGAAREQYEDRLVGIYLAESGIHTDTFLDSGDDLRRQMDWHKSISTEIRRWQDEKPKVALFSLHVTYQFRSEFFSPYSWERYQPSLIQFIGDEFKPDYIVTLIDDIAHVQRRIGPGYNIRLSEILAWRNIETMLSDLLATQTIKKTKNSDFPFEHSPIVAIRHPPEMLYRYLFNADRVVRVYASFPITKTRNLSNRVREINGFRDALHRRYCVFDPATIDDRVLQNPFEDSGHPRHSDKRKKFTKIPARERWHIPKEKSLCFEDAQELHNLSVAEIKEIALPRAKHGAKSDIDRQITTRDFRLIDQSDCVVVYRPRYGKTDISGGTREEIRYAHRTGKRVFVIHDPTEDGAFTARGLDVEIKQKDLFNEIKKLSLPSNQKKAIERVTRKIDEETPIMLSQRIKTGH